MSLVCVITIISFSYPLSALTINCDRYSNDHTGFTSKKVMESWYPDFVSFSASDFEIPDDAGTKKVVNIMNFTMGSGGNVKQFWNLLPNGKLLANFPSKAGYKDAAQGRYKCSKTSLDVRRALAKKTNSENKTETVSASSSAINDEQLCNEVFLAVGDIIAAVTYQDAKGDPVREGWINEAKSRWGENYQNTKSDYCKSLLVPALSSESPKTPSNKLEEAKSSCTELGFTAGTEKHGDCVMKLFDE